MYVYRGSATYHWQPRITLPWQSKHTDQLDTLQVEILSRLHVRRRWGNQCQDLSLAVQWMKPLFHPRHHAMLQQPMECAMVLCYSAASNTTK